MYSQFMMHGQKNIKFCLYTLKRLNLMTGYFMLLYVT